MTNSYRVRYKNGDLEIEVESSDKSYVDSKLSELIGKDVKPVVKQHGKPKPTKPAKRKAEKAVGKDEERSVDIPTLVDAINESDNHGKIEENILNKSSRLGRIILCLYYANEVLESPFLTTGDIEKITNQLGIKLSSQNASKAIKNSQKYFTADQVRKSGAIMKYKLNRKGISAFATLLKDEKLS